MAALFGGDFAVLPRICTPDVAFKSGLAAIEGRAYEGFEGLRRYIRDLNETFERFDPAFGELSEVGGSVLVPLEVEAVGRGSGVVVQSEYWIVFWFDGDLISRAERFESREEALAAAAE